MTADDTIAAISSAVGPAARMIVRMSGPKAHAIARQLSTQQTPAGGALQVDLHFAGLSVASWVYCFAAPKSYTSEDLIEFHIPGNPLLARMLLDAIITAGARHPEAGEFTARAYFSGRMDLTEAEGVAATVAAHGEQELRAARQLMAGELSRRLRPVMDLLAETLALVEAGIDFVDEGISFLPDAETHSRLARADGQLDELVRESNRFEPLTHEPTFVLIGRPNAGKSTLLNALAGHERAVVSPLAGTTRDALSAEVSLHRGIIRLIDVAGLEQTEESVTFSPFADISVQMRQQAERALESADRVILVRDSTDDRPPIAMKRPADLVIFTKADLSGQAGDLQVSAISGEGMDGLRDRLDQLAFGAPVSGSTLALNARHLSSIGDAQRALADARDVSAGTGMELIALAIREALNALAGVLGQVTPDDILGRIFSSFCIGK